MDRNDPVRLETKHSRRRRRRRSLRRCSEKIRPPFFCRLRASKENPALPEKKKSSLWQL